MKPNTAVLANLFVQGCQDAVTKVSVEALKAFASLIQSLRLCKEVAQLAPVMKPMIELLGRSLSIKDEDTICSVLDVLQDCFELEEPIINEYLEVGHLWFLNYII